MFQHRFRKSSGFTLTELMLAMSLLSVLLLAIVFLTLHISQLYTRGLVLKEVNQAGLDIVNDVRNSISNASESDLSNKSFSAYNVQLYCFGQTSYIVQRVDREDLKYPDGKIVRFSKIADVNSGICKLNNFNDVKNIVKNGRELLSSTDRKYQALSFYNDRLNSVSDGQGGVFLTMHFTIGTSDKSAVNLSVEKCYPPNDIQFGDAFCAINNFTVSSRIGNVFNTGG